MFFDFFPTVTYKVDEYNSILTDLTVAFVQKRLFINEPYRFRHYTILEGEKAEDVSYKIYGTVEFYWVILMLNKIVDPFTDWYMSSDLLYDFTEAKYPEIENDLTKSSGAYGINHYRYYYDESDSSKYLRLDEIDEYEWRYRGGRLYTTNDQFIISAPNEEGVQATGYINRIGPLGEITDIMITEHGSGYTSPPTFTVISENGYGLKGEFIQDGSETIIRFDITPNAEQIFPVSNLHYETEINIDRRDIILITPEHIRLFEEQFVQLMK